ncbi:hypothetical protein ACCC92_03255 [Mucilaginibacter sp. Mucisp84]|uniref:hypothetical protein n=1 Tax=Mucilaginibacter sp. Mucisp84 TaxID=3243058 RepID=UPI0039A5FECD
METFKLTVGSKDIVADYIRDNHLAKHEAEILKEVADAIERSDMDKLEWCNQFGNSLRHIMMNLHAYRKQQEFGFDEIAFDQYGWLKRPEFLDKEDIVFGNPHHYAEHSTLYLGRGLNQIWTYAMDYSFGLAGGGYHLSVYGKQFNSRDRAFLAGLNDLKSLMTDKLNHNDRSNYKQPVINATLYDIGKAQAATFQLSLF